MTEQIIFLEDLERDALTELVNIGVSRSAVSLRKMVGEQVILSVPSLELMTRTAAAKLIREQENEDLVAVCQDFEGAFSGRALLIFPEDSSLALAHAVAGGPLLGDEAHLMEDEALAETGNVVLNGCLASMANMLKRRLTLSLPMVLRGNGKLLFEATEVEADRRVVLFLYINFAINDRDVRGYIAMLMDLPSLGILKGLVNDFIARVVGPDEPGVV
ncbi:MAG TPA: chemotaxis protein CheX [Aliidongia sp.]|uniref:chemotaxis protein CheX n=1 Tax=Aliidongia sp. TaxID=1914230 RepID=UPI002DDD179E|nr:chemotaxis protein CheX [Aliidongia sp.]HEV2673792.1 chemotaxis protein CheX [Aliidongia sp.]